MSKEALRRLRDAVTGRRDREVEVGPDGAVHEITDDDNTSREPEKPVKATKLAARTFGN